MYDPYHTANYRDAKQLEGNLFSLRYSWRHCYSKDLSDLNKLI